MNLYYLRVLLLSALIGLTIGCASNPIAGNLSLQEAKDKCTDSNKYESSGHLMTTFSVLQKQGFDDYRAAMIAFYSQYPDLDHDYDAVKVAIKYSAAFWDWGWKSDVMSGLHSLHGGGESSINKRRENIKNALKTTLRSEELDWLSGLLIHAYGDAYAHVTKSLYTGKEVAYGGVVGHLWPSIFSGIGLATDPDDITGSKYNTFRYAQYINDFNKLFDQSLIGGPDQPMLTDLIETCEPEECLSYHTDLNKNEFVRVFTICMTSEVRKLTRDEILTAVSLIENGPSNSLGGIGE